MVISPRSVPFHILLARIARFGRLLRLMVGLKCRSVEIVAEWLTGVRYVWATQRLFHTRVVPIYRGFRHPKPYPTPE